MESNISVIQILITRISCRHLKRREDSAGSATRRTSFSSGGKNQTDVQVSERNVEDISLILDKWNKILSSDGDRGKSDALKGAGNRIKCRKKEKVTALKKRKR